MRAASALVLVSWAGFGCGSLLDARMPPPQVIGDGPDCVGTGLVRICPPLPVSTDPIATDLDTDRDCTMVGTLEEGPVCVIARSEVMVQGVVQVNGSRPLVLASLSRITIGYAAGLDASSRLRGPIIGAGAIDPIRQPAICGTATPLGPGGGTGGSFHGRGGSGGSVPGNSTGTSAASPADLRIRGGCPGTNDSEASAVPGAGGGALYLAARTEILLDGSINASGASGGGGIADEPGAGGGSGGFIGLDAPSIHGMGEIYANGGGGGGGGGSTGGGMDGDISGSPDDPGLGGAGGAGGGSQGGAGSIGTMLDGSPGLEATHTAGGGGGGAGWIFVNGEISVARSPR